MTHYKVHRYMIKCACGEQYDITRVYFSATLDIFIQGTCPSCNKESHRFLEPQEIVNWCHKLDIKLDKGVA